MPQVVISLVGKFKVSRVESLEPELSHTLRIVTAGLGSNGVTVTKFLKLLMILELYLELSYFFSWISIVVTVTEVTKVPKFLTQK